jgi:hypothetical protein
MIFFAILIISIFAGCNFIARQGYGAKKQKIENRESIEDWLTERGFSKENVVCVGSEHYYDFATGLPQAPLLFDNATGNFLAIGFSNGKYCPKDVDKSFSKILPYYLMNQKPDSFLISETRIVPPGVSIKDKKNFAVEKDTLTLTLSTIVLPLKTLTGEKIKNLSKHGDDFTLVLPFAIFLGDKLQVEDLKKFYFSALQNQFAKIGIVFLNLDKQEWWGKEWNEKIKINY